MSGDDQRIRAEHAAFEADLPAPMVLEAGRSDTLENTPALGLYRLRKTQQITGRIELSLLRKLQRAGRCKR